MTQLDLNLTLDTDLDRKRLDSLRELIQALMADGERRTLGEIRVAIGRGSEAGISARLRELDNRFGIQHEKRRRNPAEAGIWEYRINGR